MKVLYLDIDEEITAVIDKIKQTKVFDLALVIPKRSVLTQSIVNLKLLRKQIETIGKNVVVVVSDKTAYNLAKRAGLDVRSDIPIGGNVNQESMEELHEEVAIDARSDIRTQRKTEIEIGDPRDIEVHSYLDQNLENNAEQKNLIQKKHERSIIKEIEDEKKKEKKRLKNNISQKLNKPMFISRLGLKIFFIFLGVSFLVAGLIFFVLLPKAEIVIHPEKEQYISTLDVLIEGDRDSLDINNKALPGELVFFEQTSETKHFTADSQKDISTKARGQATVYNSFSSSDQPLVASTRFQTSDGVVYRLVGDATIPGATIEGGQTIPGKGIVTIEAEQSGPDYNIDSGSLTIPGLTPAKQKDIYAEITSPIVGGEQKTIRVIGERDVQSATEELASPLYESLIAKITAKASDTYFFPEGVKKEVIEKVMSNEIDTEADAFDLSIKVRVATLMFNKDDMARIIDQDVSNAVLDGKTLVNPGLDGVSAEIQHFDFESKRMGLKVSIKKDLAYDLDSNYIRQEVKGKTKTEIESFLTDAPHIDSFEVTLWPFWVTKAPKIDKKVEIVLDSVK